MKKSYVITVCLFILISCKQQILKEEKKNINTISSESLGNPDEFIGNHKTKATILGVFHFDNPGLDDYKEKYSIDILSKKRQSELEDVITSLVAYKPTKILVEVRRKESDSLINDRYKKFLNGNYSISDKKSETYQLAFRLAKKLGHTRIYASDVKNSYWFGADIDWDNYDEDEYTKSLIQYEKSNRYDYEKIYEYHDSLKTKITLKEYFKLDNDPKVRLKDHQSYLTSSILAGAGDLYIGADAVSRWYQRNLKIFANTYDIVDFSKEDRVLLLYGAGHVWQLRQLFKDSPDFEYVEINQYLSD
ncbi:hypothetical protein JQC67_18815 [Aurantibacter crassamenti]|uniref:DUF5694 domain-containing protein n=1 Tax=Aurantibacter crassamenti TaxID=1837375 RepID=UPI00193AD4CA|nr:DUF5694 domain-containing protein [Aurantibacter crassamenti]MBM1108212.1 hypothetical protein [Aurantibacter crassamenti]